jgi:PAS domain S-box-containing protein
LIWALAILTGALAAMFIAWFFSLLQEQASIATITRDRVAPLHQLFVVARDLNEIGADLPGLTGDAAQDEPVVARIAELKEEIDAQWAAYAGTYLTSEEQRLARETHKLLATTETSMARLMELHRATDGTGILLEVGARLKPSLDRLQVSFGELVDLQERVSYQEYQTATGSFHDAVLVMIIAAGLGGVAVAYAVYLIRRSILAPLSGARQAMAGIAQGQFEIDIPQSEATEVAGFLNELRDIKERFSGIQEEQRLDRRQVEEFKARLEAVFKHCPFGIFIKDLDGRFISVNETETQMWRQPVESFIGGQSADFVPERDLHRVLETDRAVMETGTPVVVEYRGTAETSYEWLQTVKFPIRGAGGELIAIGGIDIDVSERKRQEAALQRYSHHIDRAGRLAKILFWITRTDGATGERHREYNEQRMVEWSGWSEFPIDPGPYIDLLIHPDDRENVRRTYQAFQDGAFDSYVIEYRMQRKGGDYFPVRSWRERTIDPVSGDTDVYALAQDITEERKREAELMSALGAAELAARAKTDFLRTMSHELRTPLNPVIGFSELLQLKFEQQGDAASVEYLKLIREGANNLLAIINVILEFARLDAADATLAEAEFDVGSALALGIERVKARAEEIGVRISLEIKPDGLRIRADETAFRQAVGNVLANALRFTPVGGTIEVQATAAGEAIRISIVDSGPGFDPDLLDQIAKPFVRGGEALTQRYGGVGLGLTITRKLMELHGGTLQVANRAGGGAEITLVFPASRRVGGEIPETVEPLRTAAT